MIDHNYKLIEGWFDMEEQYLYLLDKVPESGYFIELGAWKGKSTSFIVTEIINRSRKVNFITIDTFEGVTDDSLDVEKNIYSEYTLNEIYDIYLKNTNHLKEYYKTIKSDSSLSSSLFEDNSIDVIFIDAGHSYESVRKDIDLWMPKMKSVSIMAGHDYGWSSVSKAVNETFTPYKIENNCWFVKISK